MSIKEDTQEAVKYLRALEPNDHPGYVEKEILSEIGDK